MKALWIVFAGVLATAPTALLAEGGSERIAEKREAFLLSQQAIHGSEASKPDTRVIVEAEKQKSSETERKSEG